MCKLCGFDEPSNQIYSDHATDRIVSTIKEIQYTRETYSERKRIAKYHRILLVEPFYFWLLGAICAIATLMNTDDSSKYAFFFTDTLGILLILSLFYSVPLYLARWSLTIPRAKYKGELEMSWGSVMPYNLVAMFKEGQYPHYRKRHSDRDHYESKIKQLQNELDSWLEQGSIFRVSLLHRYKDGNRGHFEIYMKLIREQLNIKFEEERQAKMTEFDEYTKTMRATDVVDDNWATISDSDYKLTI